MEMDKRVHKLTESEQCIVSTILLILREMYPNGFIPTRQHVQKVCFIMPTTSLEYHIPILKGIPFTGDAGEFPDVSESIQVEAVRLVKLPQFYEDEPGGYLVGYSWETNTLLISRLEGDM